jgi:hypothetical protein
MIIPLHPKQSPERIAHAAQAQIRAAIAVLHQVSLDNSQFIDTRSLTDDGFLLRELIAGARNKQRHAAVGKYEGVYP